MGQEPGAQPEADFDRHTSKKKCDLAELHTPTVELTLATAVAGKLLCRGSRDV